VFGLVALLALALAGVLWWARQRERERAGWWAAAAERASAGAVAAHEPQHASVAPSAAAEDDAPADSVNPAAWRHTVEIPELDTGDVPRRAVSAEELIDLEQQAEFFVTLGQDDAAVDLLLNHIGSAGGISPLPYLKLLEIHRHRADREAYERVREQFNQRFNAYAPAWEDRNAPARSLEDDADVMARLQAAWPTPARAMGVLEPLLFRQGTSEPVFDLAAYREVLFLYEVARDLAEHESRPSTVDFELPLEDAPSVVSYPMHNTVPVTPSAHVARPLLVDVDLGHGPEAPEQPSERSERYESNEISFGTGFGGLREEPAATKPPHPRSK
jgi:pilus assembly protein FimV